MQRQRQVEVRTCRDCRLEIMDDGGDGWVIAVYIPDQPNPVRLRSRVPYGLEVLVQEAEAMVDRRFTGKLFPDFP